MAEKGTVLVVDGDDRIIEVATQEWVESLEPGVISAWTCNETIVIPIITPSDSTYGWRVIFELPNGCFEVPMGTPGPDSTVTIAPSSSLGSMRPCRRHPQNEVAYLVESEGA